jgi:hypothetical protein
MAVGSRELHRPVLPKQAQCLVLSALDLEPTVCCGNRLTGWPTLPHGGRSRYPCPDEMNGARREKVETRFLPCCLSR